jgi:hypothetical protein
MTPQFQAIVIGQLLTVLSGYDIFYLSLERTYHPQQEQQAVKSKFDNRVNAKLRLSHAPNLSTDYRGTLLGAADSRSFSFLSGRTGKCSKHEPAPNQRVEEATQ